MEYNLNLIGIQSSLHVVRINRQNQSNGKPKSVILEKMATVVLQFVDKYLMKMRLKRTLRVSALITYRNL